MNKKKVIIILIVAVIIVGLSIAGYLFYSNLPSVKQKKSAQTATEAIDMIQDPTKFSESDLKKYFSVELVDELNSEETKKTQAELKAELGYTSTIKVDSMEILKVEGDKYFLKLNCTRTENYAIYNESHTNGATFYVTVEKRGQNFVVIEIKEEDDVSQESI